LLFSTEKLERKMEGGGNSWERRTKRPLFIRGRKEVKRCGKEEK
jgi:hypothetical protein